MSESKSNNGIGILGLLGVLFIGLKFTEYINWSWWLVLLPLYGCSLFTYLFTVIFTLIHDRKIRKNRTPREKEFWNILKTQTSSDLSYEERIQEAQRIQNGYPNDKPKPKSRFQQRLDDAMKIQKNRRL